MVEALVCKTSLNGFESRRYLQSFRKMPQASSVCIGDCCLVEFGLYSGREKRKEASFLPVVILSERPRRQGYAPPRLKKRRALDRCGPL